MGELLLVRHGETDWSRQGRHTGRTDVELTGPGREQAAEVGRLLVGRSPVRVLASPLVRASDTARLALGAAPPTDDRLLEWDYGQLEGLTTEQWLADHPDWVLWRDGCPGGESPGQVAARAESLLAELVGELDRGDVLLFAHGHVLRVLAARWLGLAPAAGALFVLDPATLSVLGTEHGRPAMRMWNRPVGA